MQPKSASTQPRAHKDISDAEWDAFVERHLHGHILQTREWGKLKSQHGWKAARASVMTQHNHLVSTSLVLLRQLPFGLGKIAYVPRGPVVDWDDEAYVSQALKTTAKLAKNAGAFAVIYEPDLLDTSSDKRILERNNLVPLDFDVQPRRTIWVNLDVDEDVDMLRAMKEKTRYNIGLAKRKGVTVRVGSNEDAATYFDLMKATAARDAFSIHGLDYYRDFLRLFARDEASPARLFIAEHEDKPLAALIVTALGERAIYLYGASSNEKRELMPTYLLQWEAMLWSRNRGCKTYDLWGVPDEDEATLEANFMQRSDELWGVYRFKRGFGGQVVRYAGAWAQVISPMRWWAYQQAIRLRRAHGLGA
jgi:lipid II:glycine glycyltransferase (peptidoglycan interpeptide bridge formation enzyme)